MSTVETCVTSDKRYYSDADWARAIVHDWESNRMWQKNGYIYYLQWVTTTPQELSSVPTRRNVPPNHRGGR